MSTFGEEPNHYQREFLCGWSSRPATAREVAVRVQATARGLAGVDAEYGDLWPLLGVRAVRRSDPGPVLALATDDLAAVIDRHGRFDPPPLPHPVGPDGYSISFTGYPNARDRRHRLGITVQAGNCRDGGDNSVGIVFGNNFPIWHEPEQALSILDMLVSAWNAEWASAYAAVDAPIPASGPVPKMQRRPWLVWTRAPVVLKPIMPFGEGELAVAPQPHMGGDLRIWP